MPSMWERSCPSFGAVTECKPNSSPFQRCMLRENTTTQSGTHLAVLPQPALTLGLLKLLEFLLAGSNF